MNRCIVSVGAGSWYPRGIRRLRDTLRNVGYSGGRMLWENDLPPGCPTHHDSPYAFKTYALTMAVMRGDQTLLWCDASTWFLRDPAPIFEWVERHGYYLWRNPCEDLGAYAADHTLDVMNVDREESFTVPMVVSTIFGVSTRVAPGPEILTRLVSAAKRGAFNAPWVNDPSGQSWHPGMRAACGSPDSRVKGCRHDQAALSCIAYKMGLNLDERSPSELIGYPSMPHSSDVIALAEDDGGASIDAWEQDGWLKT